MSEVAHRVVSLQVYAAGQPEDYPPCLEGWTVRGDRHCPACGGTPVCEERSEGDYYLGPSWACPRCGARFCLPLCDPEAGEEEDFGKLVAALRAALGGTGGG